MLHKSRRSDAGNAWKGSLIACLGLALLSQGQVASAQTLDLQLSCPSLTFADTDPHSLADTPAQENPVSAIVNYSGLGVLHIYMLANGNMTSAGNGPPVPASSVYWTANGSGYLGGKMSTVQTVEAASGRLTPEPGAGWRFFLKHGCYDSGAYQLSVTVVATVQ